MPFNFNTTWRKRLACERCRQLKVRCEYSSPTSDSCMRCERSHKHCVIPNSKGLGGQNENFNEDSKHNIFLNSDEDSSLVIKRAVYLRQIIQDAEQRLADLGVSPFKQAVAAGVYTVEECQQYYDQFRENPLLFPAIMELNMPGSIEQLDVKWPWMTIAIVTVKAMNAVGKQVRDIQFYVQGLYRNVLNELAPKVTLDRQLAFCLICIYAQNFRDRALNALLSLHGMTLTTIRQLRSDRQDHFIRFALDAAAMAIFPYTICKEFSVIIYIAHCYQDMMKSNTKLGTLASRSIANILIEASCTYEQAMINLDSALTLEDISKIMNFSFQSIEVLESELSVRSNYLPNGDLDSATSGENKLSPITPVTGFFLATKIKLAKKCALRFLDIKSCCMAIPATTLLPDIIARAANYSSTLLRTFADTDKTKPFLPSALFYHISDTLLCLQMMRFVSFAGKVDIDVRVDCLFEVVMLKWEDLVRTNILIRQLFILLMTPTDMAQIKIGYIDEKENGVYGSGSSDKFNIIHCDSTKKPASYRAHSMSAEQLLELILVIISRAAEKTEGDSSELWDTKTNDLNLSLVLQFLAHEV